MYSTPSNLGTMQRMENHYQANKGVKKMDLIKMVMQVLRALMPEEVKLTQKDIDALQQALYKEFAEPLMTEEERYKERVARATYAAIKAGYTGEKRREAIRRLSHVKHGKIVVEDDRIEVEEDEWGRS